MAVNFSGICRQNSKLTISALRYPLPTILPSEALRKDTNEGKTVIPLFFRGLKYREDIDRNFIQKKKKDKIYIF